MIQDKQLLLRKEFENYLQFWTQHMLTNDQKGIFPEISVADVPNEKADLGSMYLSRIIYGASQACSTLETDRYVSLAQIALEMLKEFKNPLGGYFWGRKYNMEWLQDGENNNMAQAFVLYGLGEYARLNDSQSVNQLIDEQLEFIESTLKDDSGTYFLDGFDEQWVRGQEMTRSFATHFHLMEALVKIYENRKDPAIKTSIQKLLYTIHDRFIDQEDYYCIHRFSEDWQRLPNENWAGHNAECSWVICHASRLIKDEELIKKSEEIAVLMMDKVIELARDESHGGYTNLISENGTMEKEKSWWPQAEIVLGLLNVFTITGDQQYQQLAYNQINYIQENFVTESGEWLGAVDETGEVVASTPKIFFWKSMYHTVRYYDYLLQFT